MRQILRQAKYLSIQQDIAKLDKHYLKGSLSLHDYLTIRISLEKVITKQCCYPCQSNNVGNYLRAIGILKKVLPLRNLIVIFTWLSLSTSLVIGSNLGLVIMGMVLLVQCYGLLSHHLNNLLSIENSMLAKSLPQIWQI